MKNNAKHLSGILHVTGKSKFTGEENLPANINYVGIKFSEMPKAEIKAINTDKVESLNGVISVITAKDIPGINNVSHGLDIQPLLASGEVMHVGQPIALVVAESQALADKAANLIDVDYDEREAIISLEDAIAKKSFFDPPRIIRKGNVEEAFSNCDFVIEDTVDLLTAQEHLYLETQRSMAIPDDDGGYTIYASTQSTTDTQKMTAKILNLPQNKITVDVKRLGGAFGGKEFQAALWGAMAGLAAHHSQSPVLLKLNRPNDMIASGKRHPFKVNYKFGFNKDGKFQALKSNLYANGGAFADLSIAILERGLFHSDHAYYFPNAQITGYVCKTNIVPNTAYRGFGGPQGIFPTELAVERAAKILKMDPVEIRKINMYAEGQTTHYEMKVKEAVGPDMLQKVMENSKYLEIKKKVKDFNNSHKFIKRGIGIMPGKFGISFTAGFLNQGSALIWIYGDGTISLSHGGVEMGQQVNLKVATVVARSLGVSLDKIRVESSNTKRVGNASPTAASTGSDINGNAALNACKKLKKRLRKAAAKYFLENNNLSIEEKNIEFADNLVFDKENPATKIEFSSLANFAYMNTIDLGAHGYYYTEGIEFDRDIWQGKPFNYFVYGASISLVEVDILTGEYSLKETHIVHDSSKSLNEEIDKGQIYGAFVQGYGYCTMEEMIPNKKGEYKASSLSTYKVPTIFDIPDVFDIDMIDIGRDESSVLKSKAVGEPPFIYGLSGWFALHNAIDSMNKTDKQINLKFPATPEAVLLAIDEIQKKEN